MSAAELPAVSPGDSPTWSRDPGFWIVAVLATFLFFTRFHCPLQEPQEARYAEIPRQMLEQHSFLVPVLHGQPYLDKPPLFYWLVMASYTALGVHDWAARLVACAVGFVCVLATYFWGRRLAGPRAAFLGALILCLSPRFLQLERLLTMDGLLCLCVIGAWAMVYPSPPTPLPQGERGERRRLGWWLLSALVCGLGLLAKGPVALMLVLPPLLMCRWMQPPASRIPWTWYVIYTAAATAIAAPWYVALGLRDPSFFEYFFWFHHVRRFVEPFDHAEPVWFYLPELLGGMLPWTLLLPGAMVYLVRRSRSEKARSIWLALGAGGWCLLFFTLAGCKRPAYLLPAYPAFAVGLGCYLNAIIPMGATRREAWQALLCQRWALAGVATLAVLMLGAVYRVMPEYARSYSYRGLVRRHASEYESSDVPVICYPRRWDSVSFYLQRSDVRAYAAADLPALIAELQAHPEALVFLKNGRGEISPSAELLAQLPGSLVFEPLGRQGMLKVGRVVHRGRPSLARP
jgi:4-amino-4-deoxy-L-arabinose transferase-like glycosyltransferase